MFPGREPLGPSRPLSGFWSLFQPSHPRGDGPEQVPLAQVFLSPEKEQRASRLAGALQGKSGLEPKAKFQEGHKNPGAEKGELTGPPNSKGRGRRRRQRKEPGSITKEAGEGLRVKKEGPALPLPGSAASPPFNVAPGLLLEGQLNAKGRPIPPWEVRPRRLALNGLLS